MVASPVDIRLAKMGIYHSRNYACSESNVVYVTYAELKEQYNHTPGGNMQSVSRKVEGSPCAQLRKHGLY